MELQDGSDGSPPSVASNTLRSLVPVLNMLPGCVVENGIYYVNGLASLDTRREIAEYTASITRFIFGWRPQDHIESLSPGALLQLFNISNPLFPNLSHLDISTGLNDTIDLSYLNIFLSPSLRTVRISSIPPDQRRHVDFFFAALSEAVPRLEGLHISYQSLPPSAFDSIRHFQSLQELALIQVAYDYDDAFVYQLGSLPHLRTLVIDSCRTRERSHFRGSFSRGCGHCALVPCPPDCRPVPHTPPPQSDAAPSDDNVSFPSLQKLDITGYLPEIHLFLQSVSPTRVERLTVQLALATFDSTPNTRELTRQWVEVSFATQQLSNTPNAEEHAQIQGFGDCLEQFLSSASVLSFLSISRVQPTYSFATAGDLLQERVSLPLSTLVAILSKSTLRQLDFGMWATPLPALQEAMDVISHQSPSGAKPELETLRVWSHSPPNLPSIAKLVRAYPTLEHLTCTVKTDFDTIQTSAQQATAPTPPSESLRSLTLLHADSPSVQATNQAIISAAFYIHTTFPNAILIIPGEKAHLASLETPLPKFGSHFMWSLTREDAKVIWVQIQQLTELCMLSVTNYVERTKSQTS